VLAAVNRLAVGEFVPALDPASPLVAEAGARDARALGQKAGALPAGSVLIDSAAFTTRTAARAATARPRPAGASSASARARRPPPAPWARWLEMAGLPIASHRPGLLARRICASRLAGRGRLGADVAAAVHGGVLQSPPGRAARRCCAA